MQGWRARRAYQKTNHRRFSPPGMPKGIAGRADAQSKVEEMEHGFAQNVMAGFSIEEVRQLVELWEESQEIANGPDPEWSAVASWSAAIASIASGALALISKRLNAGCARFLTLTQSHAAAGSAARGALRQFPQASPARRLEQVARTRRARTAPRRYPRACGATAY